MPETSDIPEEITEIRIPEQKVFDGRPFPLVLAPNPSHVDRDAAYWIKWSTDNIDRLKLLLHQNGAILFRKFPFEPADFDLFAKTFGWEEFPYVGGLATRKQIVGNVYTTNEAPPDRPIRFHHEMAHIPIYPKKLFFYCDIPPPQGGETALALSHIIHRLMAEREPEFVKRLTDEGIVYVRVAPEETDHSTTYGRSWKSSFFVETREEAEIKAKEAGFDFEWMPDNSMKTITKALPAIKVNEHTGRTLWFNTALGYTRAKPDSRNPHGETVLFPNGDKMPPAAIDTLEKTADQDAGVEFRWEKKDIVLIDNMQVLHARRCFTPPRRIFVSLFK
jgi:alpha-ketoglutarate-dependent taurine dioxygenase